MKSLPTRRHVIRILPLAGLGLLAACSDKPAPAPAPAPAAAPPPAPAPAPVAPAPAAPAPAATAGGAVTEDEALAKSLGYVADNSRVDRAKHANFAPEQRCGSCALYQGAAGSTSGGCPLFGGRQVAASGWCTGWARKA